MAFYHGIETQEVDVGGNPILAVSAAVIGIVGIAPKGPTQKLIIVAGQDDLAQFGLPLPGFTIPQALATMVAEKSSIIIVTNVFNEATMTTAVAAEIVTMTAGVGKTAFGIISSLVVKNAGATITYILGTDYTFMDDGKITLVPTGSAATAASLSVSYKKFTPGSVTAPTIIGTIDPLTDARTGMKLWDTCLNDLQIEPRLLGAPGFSHLSAVVSELAAWADELKSTFVAIPPDGTTIPQAIDARKATGTLNVNVFADEFIPAYPAKTLSYNKTTDAWELQPSDATVLGGCSASISDESRGYWTSPSNWPLKSIKGLDVKITGSAFSKGKAINKLNEVGYISFLFEGSDVRLWGNRNGSFSLTNQGINTFITTRWVRNVLLRSVQIASKPFLGKPIDQFTIDSIKSTVNDFINTLINRRAVLKGSECIFEKNLNPDADMLNGQLCFTIKHLNGPTLEHLIYRSVIDLTLISQLS